MTRFGILLPLVALLGLPAGPAAAQPANEIFFGYSYLRADTGEADIVGGGTAQLDSANAHGIEVAGTWFATSRAGIEVSFGRNSGSFSLEGVDLPDSDIEITEGDANQWSFLVGPRFRLVGGPRHSLDARALVGGTSLEIRVPVSVTNFRNDEFGFGAAFGAAYTVHFNEAFSFRVIQPDLFIATAGPGTSASLRVSTGIVIRVN